MTKSAPVEKHWTRRIFAPVCVLLIAGGILFLSDIGYIKAAEHWTADWRTALFSHRNASQDPNVALVMVTEDTLADAPVRIPMDRHIQAKIIRAIASAEPAALGIDIIYARKTTLEADADLMSAIKDAKVPIVLGTVDESSNLPERQIAYHRKFLAEAKRPAGHVFFERKSDPFAISDQTIRNMALGHIFEGGVTSLALALAKIKKPDAEPLNATITWLLPPKDGSQPFYEVDAADLLGEPGDAAPLLAGLKNKLVLLGTDLVDVDRHLTPLSVADDARVPGVLIHANIVSQLLDGRWIQKLGQLAELVLLVLIAALGYWISRHYAIGKFTKTLAILGSTALVLAGFAAFKFGNYIVPYATALTAWIASVGLGQHIDHHYSRLQKLGSIFSSKGRLSWRVMHRLGSMAFWR